MEATNITSNSIDRTAIRSRVKYYIAGFALSLVLTIDAFVVVMNRNLSEQHTIITIFALAIIQFIIQMVFFLHLGKGSRWNSGVFFMMLLVVFILVVGSIWIMANLNYNMMSPEMMDEHMIEAAQKGI